MIDPRTFVSDDAGKSISGKFKIIEGSFSCPEQGCYEVSKEGHYDEENRKVFWTCPNGHDGSARL